MSAETLDAGARPVLARLVDAVNASRWSYVDPGLAPALELAEAFLAAAAAPDRPSRPGELDTSPPDPGDVTGDQLRLDPAAWQGARCSSCSRPVMWLTHVGTGNAAPIDPVPNGEGNVALIEPGHYTVLTKSDLAQARETGKPQLYSTHFQTCIYADRHRKGPRR